MNIRELYNTLEDQYWIEPTNKEDKVQNRRWLLNQPVKNILGGYTFDYVNNGSSKRETGEYSIEIIEGRPIIKIQEAEFYLDFREIDGQMIWHSESGESRTFSMEANQDLDPR